MNVVIVTGEVDTQTAPERSCLLAAQLAVAQVAVVNLDGVEFLASAGLTGLKASKLAVKLDCDLRLSVTARALTAH